MIKTICSLLFTIVGLNLINAQHQNQEYLYFLETDSTWRKELFIFPISFAPDIAYTGEEDARFPEGWENQDNDNFWSYSFAWNISNSERITTKKLESDLTIYFNGLMRWDETAVNLEETATSDKVQMLSGKIETKDAFFTQQPMTLNVQIELYPCTELKKSIVHFRFSPKPLNHSVWDHLREVELPEEMKACEATKTRKIHDLLSKSSDYGHFNGSALVAHKGEVVYKNGFGKANMDWDIPNKSNTKHRLASITKQFTATLIMQLVEEGLINLNEPISTYLPEFPKEKGDIITTHHLLTHASGLPNYTSFDSYREIMKKSHQTTDLMALFVDRPLEFTPGEQFNYSNSGYVTLGYLIEKITGKLYDHNLRERIFEPLEMMDSGFEINRKVSKNKSSGYHRMANTFENANFIDMSAAHAAGGLYSTVEDLYKWDRAWYHNSLISQELKTKMYKEHIPSWGGQHYGYGWELGSIGVGDSDKRLETIGHGGFINGYNTLITRIPSSESLVVFLNNTGDAPLIDMTSSIMGILNDEPYTTPRKIFGYELLDVLEEKGEEAATSFFEKNFGSDEYLIIERHMNVSGYKLLREGNIEKAIKYFELSTKAFPNSFNIYDSYGEALLTGGDTTRAITNYKKSIRLNPGNQNGIDILNDLGVNTDDLLVKIPTERLKLLSGEYQAEDDSREWKITIEQVDGTLYGIDGGYRYRLLPVGSDKFVNPDDGAKVEFDASDEDNITFVIFGRFRFNKIE